MEAELQLDNLIIKLCKEQMLTLTKVEWPASLCSQLYDYLAELKIGPYQVNGRGTSSDENVAIRKAFAECYERLIVKENSIKNTNGCAVYFDLKSAKKSSKLELIERDWFLLGYHSKMKMAELQTMVHSNLRNYLIKMSAQVECYTNSMPDCALAMCYIKSKEGAFLGLGADELSMEISLEKSIIEATRQFIYFLKYPEAARETNFANFHQITKPSFQDHANLMFNGEYLMKFEDWLHSEQTQTYKLPYDDFGYSEYKSYLLPEVPLYFSKCENVSAIELYTGMPDMNSISFRIISRDVGYSELNSSPHPLR
ncbi:MAG: YcaO-like family protein [Pseudobdellovibrio sp.]